MGFSMSFISELSAAKKITPIVVCGAARSGTRMATDLLNIHNEVAIQNEMHAGTVEAYFEMLDKVKETFKLHSERKGRVLDGLWESSRCSLTHAFLMSACKKGPVGAEKKALRYHGIKTPGFERYFTKFEEAFSGSSPYYVYCVRSVDKVWSSWISLGYLTDVAVFKKRYERSLRQAKAIKKASSERFVLFDLDAYASVADKVKFVENNLFLPLGLSGSSEYVDLLEAAPNRNSLKRTGVKPIESNELKAQMEMLKSCSVISELRRDIGCL